MKNLIAKTTYVLLLSGLLFACNSKKAAEDVAKLKDEVMTVHDKLMPESLEAENLTAQLEERLAKLNKKDKNYEAQKAQIDSLTALLTDAQDEMMTWMNEYSDDSLSKMNDADAIKYLESEKRKINQVKELTDKNFGTVKDYLN
jgi:uncharacterized protein YceH (UPF0502 family)